MLIHLISNTADFSPYPDCNLTYVQLHLGHSAENWSLPSILCDSRWVYWTSEKLRVLWKGVAASVREDTGVHRRNPSVLKLGGKFQPKSRPPVTDSKNEEYLISFEFHAFWNSFYISFVDLLDLPLQTVTWKPCHISQTCKIQNCKASLLSFYQINGIRLFMR